MRGRAAALLGVLLVALMAAPQFTAAPTGIGSAGDQGCTCHGGASPDTSVLVDGLPESYNASETYTFTVTVVNDVMTLYDDGGDDWNGHAGGYRILVSHGDVVAVPESQGHIMDGGLTHTSEGNTVRSWTFEWTAPAADDLNVEMTVYGNAVNGGAGSGGDYWNSVVLNIPGINAGSVAPSASALIIFLTSIGLAAGLIFVGVLWVFYRRSPETFTMERFWGFLKPWLTTTDHKELFYQANFRWICQKKDYVVVFFNYYVPMSNDDLTSTKYCSHGGSRW